MLGQVGGGAAQRLSQGVHVALPPLARRLAHHAIVLLVRHVQRVVHDVVVHRQEERDVADVVQERNLHTGSKSKKKKRLK